MSKPGRPTSPSNAAAEQNSSRKASKQRDGATDLSRRKAERQAVREQSVQQTDQKYEQAPSEGAKACVALPGAGQRTRSTKATALGSAQACKTPHTHTQEHTRRELGGRSPRHRRVTRTGTMGMLTDVVSCKRRCQAQRPARVWYGRAPRHGRAGHGRTCKMRRDKGERGKRGGDSMGCKHETTKQGEPKQAGGRSPGRPRSGGL